MISKELLKKLYCEDKKSAVQIAKKLKFSAHKINYWLAKYDIPKRSISDASYAKWNPKGDPFNDRKFLNKRDAIIFGLGLGLYWGEGTKASTSAVRLGNTDPKLIKMFIKFLEIIYHIKRDKLRFAVQIFQDLDVKKVTKYWAKYLKVPISHFYKTTVSISSRKGTYKRKMQYGVLTVFYNNTKLRNILVKEVAEVENTLNQY